MKNKFIFLELSIFLFVLIVAFVTRFYLLGKTPKGLYIDEAGQGYSAYSILKTDKDEFGKKFPIVFRSFTDFKTPIYIYLIVPLIPIFGLSPFTVRFPSFLFSILTFPIFYLLIKKLAPSKAIILALISSLLLAISPWHILFGRTNFECNVALFFFLSGIYSFYLSLNKPKWLIISAVFFAIAIPAYHSQRIITPLMFIFLLFRYHKKLFSETHKKYLIFSLIIGFIISLPTLKVAFTPGFLARATGLNIFSTKEKLPAGYLSNYRGPLNKFVNNTTLLSIKEFASLYVSYFSPRNMFILGDYGPRSSFPDLSTFFIWQLPFYLYGFYILIKNKNLKELKFFTLVLLLISPIPAAVTRDPYSTIRALPLVIPQIIIISLGIIETIKILKKRHLQILFGVVATFVVVYSLGKLFSSAIILNEYYRARYWDYGWEEVVAKIKTFDPTLPVVIDNARFEPYIQVAFFLKYDPATFQKDNFEVSPKDYYIKMDRVRDKKLGNITSRAINWEKDLTIDQYLIGDELAISTDQINKHKLTLVSEILYPDKSFAYRIVKTK